MKTVMRVDTYEVRHELRREALPSFPKEQLEREAREMLEAIRRDEALLLRAQFDAARYFRSYWRPSA